MTATAHDAVTYNYIESLDVHRSVVIVDAVCPGIDEPLSWRAWVEGGAAVVAPTLTPDRSAGEALRTIARWHRWFRDYADEITPVHRVDDVARARREGKLGVVLAFQNSALFEDEPDLVWTFAALGTRIVQLTYNVRNRIGDGCGEPTDAGLSQLGRIMVREMNRAGIVVDLSHTGYRTTMDAMEVSTKPPVFSHSNARSLCESGRNIRDDQIRRIRELNGLVGIGGFPAFVRRDRRPTIDDLVDHIDYMVQLIGPAHVGLGLDFFRGVTEPTYEELIRRGYWYPADYPPPPHPYPTGIDEPSKLPAITSRLLTRGYSQADVAMIMGGSWLRLFGEVWAS